MSKDRTRLKEQHVADIAAHLRCLNGDSISPPDSGEVWVGDGKVDIHTEQGIIGHALRNEDDGWWFEPCEWFIEV